MKTFENYIDEMAGAFGIVSCKDMNDPNINVWGAGSDLNCKKKKKEKVLKMKFKDWVESRGVHESTGTNVKDAIVDLAKGLEAVFKRHSRQTRLKAWEKITSKDGEKEVKKIINDPKRPINTFQKLASKEEK